MSRRRRIVLALAALVLLGLFLPPFVSLNRFRGRIAVALGRALDRQVTVRDVTLRLLPRPGFDLTGVVVAEDPAFSAEPMLRADSVAATLRLASLWRGRLEIASLSLDAPSLNLVRREDGRWNIEGLLMRASQTPSAPTGTTRPQARPRFPYVQADQGRINFKLGQEKQAFTLSEADFSLWLEAENEWNMRLEARPLRTDSNLTDTGLLRVSGTFGRASSFREMPLHLRLSLRDAQLGALTALVYGRDRGFRGGVEVNGGIAGSPADLELALDATLDDFRRYDILTGSPLRLRMQCAGKYQVEPERLHDLSCRLPLDDGAVEARGEVSGTFSGRRYDLGITANDLPASMALELVRRSKRGVGEDLNAAGTLMASFVLRTSEGLDSWSGGGTVKRLRLQSSTLAPVLFGDIPFSVQPHPAATSRAPRAGLPPNQQRALVVGPATFALGGATARGVAAPVRADATLTATHYQVVLQGDTEVGRLLGVARALGVNAPRSDVSAMATVHMTVAGDWAGFAPPEVTGTLYLRNGRVRLPGVADPVLLSSAEVTVAPGDVNISRIQARFAAGAPIEGSVRLQRPCDTAASCRIHFDLKTDVLALDEVNRLLNPQLHKRPWYSFVAGGQRSDSGWSRLTLEGRMAAGTLAIKQMVARNVSADIAFHQGRLQVKNLRGQVLGGHHHQGEWKADFTGSTPTYSGTGTVDGLSMAQVSTLMRDNWCAGVLRGSYRVALSGWNAEELAASTAGSAEFEWRDGALRRIFLNAGAPLRFRLFRGHAMLRDGAISFSESRLETAGGIYSLSGTASLARELDLKLTPRSGAAFAITGTLSKPTVVEGAATQASLRE